MNLALSIIIPVYNGEKYIQEAIASCITPNLKNNYEIIIVDDGSVDATLNKIKKFKGIKNIKVLQQSNSGSAAARNLGIRTSVGKFVCFLDADDIYLKGTIDFFLQLVANLENSRKGFYCNYIRMTDVGLFDAYVRVAEPFKPPLRYTQFLLPKKFPILTSTVLINRAELLEMGGFNERFLRCQDLELWTRIVERFDIQKLNICSSGRRIHKDQVTQNRSEIIFWREEVNISFLNRVDFKNFCTSPDQYTQAKTAEFFGDIMCKADEPLYRTAEWLYDFSFKIAPTQEIIRKKDELKKCCAYINLQNLR